MNINWTKVQKVAKVSAMVGSAAMLANYIIAKTNYYKKAAQTMEKTNEYLDKTGKLIENTLD